MTALIGYGRADSRIKKDELAKQGRQQEVYDELPHRYFKENQLHAFLIIEEKRLDPWVHNKTIQKAVESLRITDEKKEYLKTLRIK